jgi:general secretion pathway protein D
LSKVSSNQKRRWLKRLLNVGAQRALLFAPALLCPITLTNTAVGQQPAAATRSISDGTVTVDASYVLAWLDYSKQMADLNNTDQAVSAFAEALRGRNQQNIKDARVEERVGAVANHLASKNVTVDAVKAAASKLGAPRPVPASSANALNRPGTMPTQNPQVVTTGTASASGATVTPSVFNPSQDASQLRQASSQIQIAPTTFAPDASGDEYYQRGLDLLKNGDRANAKEAFLQAWKKQNELDPAIRNSLKDKLTQLQATAPESIEAQQVSPADEAALQERNRWLGEVTGEIADAKKHRESEPMVVADRLQTLRNRVSQANLDGDARKRMLTLIDREITEHQLYISNNRAAIDQNSRNRQIKEQVSREQEESYKVDQQVASLVETYNDLMDKGEFMQAETVAKQVGALDRDSTIASLLIASARNKRRNGEYETIVRAKEDGFIDSMLDVDRSAEPISDENSYQLPKGWEGLSRQRLASQERDSRRGMSPAEAAIWEKLKQPVMVNFTQRPLEEVCKTLESMTGISFYIDRPSLTQEGINPDVMVTLDLPSQISLRSALSLLLNSRNLDFQVTNEVLMITSVRNTKQANRTYTYSVKDLVLPIPNFVTDYNSGMAGALRNAYESINSGLATRSQPRIAAGPADTMMASASLNPESGVLGQLQPGGGMRMGPGMGPAMGMGMGGGFGMGGMGAGGMGGFGSSFGGPTMGGPPMIGMGGAQPISGGAAQADFSTLMRLIMETIDPESWLLAGSGGSSTIVPYPANLSMVVNAPQTTHERIAELLESLRRLQDLQVTVEVKFITLTDNFFENIGVDFDVRIADKNQQLRTSEDQGPTQVVGLSSGASAANPFPFTRNLDVVFDNSNTIAASPFGGVTGAGASIGFAILSDLEMFFFMNAAQGDQRTNVLQAPRVTMFDGQAASINDTIATLPLLNNRSSWF